jgi:hypothetical protein
MVEVTVQLPDKLAAKIGASGMWFPIIIELGTTNFKYPEPAQARAELVEFLSQNPAPRQVSDYFLSDAHQRRLDYLLDLNGEGEIGDAQKEELSEWTKLNHISILLKAKAAKMSENQN